MRRLIVWSKSGLMVAGLLAGSLVQSQCEFEPSEKVQKLLDKSEDKKKYDSDKRYQFLEDALEEDEKCWPCLQRLGVLEFKRAKRSGGSFSGAEYRLNKIVEECPDYHSDPLYYLGAIKYANQEYDLALKYFNEFLHFPDEDPSKFNKDYDKKYEEVSEVIPDVEFWEAFYNSGITADPKVVQGVSTSANEYFPAISPDGEIMFYTRVSKKKAKGDLYSIDVEEFTWSFRPDINGSFDEGRPLEKPFNVGSNYGGASISVDNKELYIAAKNPIPENKENFDIFRTSYELAYNEASGKDEWHWTELEELGDNVNTVQWDSQPSLSGDGQMLFFSRIDTTCIMRRPGEPSHDIFMCRRQEDGSWGKAIRLDETINTPGEEKSPFIHGDSKTLYFASSGLKGRGGMDIFYCKMNDDGTFTEPRNLGHPVNTTEDETGMIVSADGEVGYFFSNRIRGARGYDIFSFQMPEQAKPEKVMVLKGKALNEDGEPAAEARVKLNYVQSKESQEIEVYGADGSYATIVNVERGEDVLMSVIGDDVAFNSRLVATQEDEDPPAVMKLEIETQEIGTNKPFLINDIYYSTNSAEIDRSSKLILVEFAAYLLENPSLQIEIRGHTDDVGSEEDNLALSMDRAFEVKGFLEKNGVPGKRISAQGFGEGKPISSNDFESGKAKNRRTEFVITRM